MDFFSWCNVSILLEIEIKLYENIFPLLFLSGFGNIKLSLPLITQIPYFVVYEFNTA